MNYFDEIKSEEAEGNLLFKKEDKYIIDKNEKNKLDNFEILSKLGKGSFGNVFKVRYKLNNCIYALKRIPKNYNSEDKIKEKYIWREIEILTQLKHPHIIKYYETFEDEKYIYLIIEYANNGSLDHLVYKLKDIKIKNDFVWNLFLQCISGLSYIHSKNIIHRDINPENLLLDNNMILKISDFGVSKKIEKDNNHLTFVGKNGFLAPEMFTEIYDEKVDIFSLGMVIKKCCDFIENSKDKELLTLISLMIKENPNERPSAKELLIQVKQIYNSKYLKNTSMDSLIRCLYSLRPMTSYFLNLNDYSIMNFIQSYVKCLEAFTDKDINEWFNALENIRNYLENRNPLFIKCKEIEPSVLLAYIFEGLHSELNKPFMKDNKNNYYIICQELLTKTDKNETKLNYINNFLLKQNSYISNNFMGLYKEIRICKECELKTYNFKSYFYITFDLPKMFCENKDKNKQINLEECFAIQKKEERIKDIMCSNCYKFTSHSCYNFVYSSPLLLIINIKNDCENKVELYLNEILDLKEHVEFKNLPTKFKLKGIIKKKHEKYLSNINIENIWFICENKNIEKINFKNTKETNENIMMLFYQSIK